MAQLSAEDPFVDEEWYLAQYPDVRKGIEQGSQKSARHHFLTYGLAEGRKPYAFDEAWYRETNPDLIPALDVGKISSLEQHFLAHGRFEGRRATPPVLPQHPRVLAYGAFGTNNVGDEAIFEGLKLEHPNIIQITAHRATNRYALRISHALTYSGLFRKDSKLIIGGGGLLHSSGFIQEMLELARVARSAGATIHILGLGCEGAMPEFHEDIKALVALAETVTVRTNMSVEILKAITGKVPVRVDDFAFGLAGSVKPAPQHSRGHKLVGVVTDGDLRSSYAQITAALARQIHSGKGDGCKFVHIPHVRAYCDRNNNDIIVGESIWSELSLHSASDSDAFFLRPFSNDPREVLSYYATLDGVISSRFHGLLFAHLSKLPTLALAHTRKNRAFVDDYAREDLFVSHDPADFPRAFSTFMAAVLERSNRST